MRMYSAMPPDEQLAAWKADREAAKRPKEKALTVVPAGTKQPQADAPEAAEAYTAVYTPPAAAPVLTQPEATEAGSNYHAVIIGEAEVPPQAPAVVQNPVLNEPEVAEPDVGRRSLEFPDPRTSSSAGPAERKDGPTDRVLPAVGWERLGDLLIEELPVDERHRLTTKLLRVMTTEKSEARA